jgi:hypothetical protein
VVKDSKQEEPILNRLNAERNNIGHGREFRQATELRDDLVRFMNLEDWQRKLQDLGPPNIDDLDPWITTRPRARKDLTSDLEDDFGILDKWSKKSFQYLIPHSGLTFEIEPV